MKLSNQLKLKVGVLVALLGFANNALAAPPVLGDYNGDGRSDFAYAKVSRSRTSRGTNFFVRDTSSGNVTKFSFSIPGDAIVAGKFFSDGKTYPGIVYVSDAKKPLNWYVKNPNGGENSFQFGSPGDNIPNQGDVDCDGITDYTVSRTSGSSRIWYSLLSKSGIVFRTDFGVSSDSTGIADIDGNGCADLISLRLENGKFNWYSRSIFDAAVTKVEHGSAGEYPVLPQQISPDGKAEYIVAGNAGDKQLFFVKHNNGVLQTIAGGAVDSIPMIGNFIGGNHVAWATRKNRDVSYNLGNVNSVSFAFGETDAIIIRPDGSVVQPSESGKLGSSSSGGGGGGSTTEGDLTCDEYKSTSDGRSKHFTWNPDSSRGLKAIFPAEYDFQMSNDEGDVATYTSDGKLYNEFYRAFPNEGGSRPRWYAGRSKNGYASNVTLRLKLTSGKNLCYRIPNPRNRYD